MIRLLKPSFLKIIIFLELVFYLSLITLIISGTFLWIFPHRDFSGIYECSTYRGLRIIDYYFLPILIPIYFFAGLIDQIIVKKKIKVIIILLFMLIAFALIYSNLRGRFCGNCTYRWENSYLERYFVCSNKSTDLCTDARPTF